jgi:hypothetical protein
MTEQKIGETVSKVCLNARNAKNPQTQIRRSQRAQIYIADTVPLCELWLRRTYVCENSLRTLWLKNVSFKTVSYENPTFQV